jgi:hypothetical protein
MPKASTALGSWWRLSADVMVARVLVWVALTGRDAELTSDAHLYFADRYSRLANIHLAHGRARRASQLGQKAERHLEAAGWDGPPYAAAMGMPRPRRLVFTNAVSGRLHDPGDAA